MITLPTWAWNIIEPSLTAGGVALLAWAGLGIRKGWKVFIDTMTSVCAAADAVPGMKADIASINAELKPIDGKSLTQTVAAMGEQIGEVSNRFLGMEATMLAIVANDRDNIFMCDGDGNVISISRGMTRLTGLELSGFKDGGGVRAIHPDDRDRVLATWEISRKSGKIFSSTFRYMHLHTHVVTHCSVEAVATKVADRIISWSGRVDVETTEPSAPDPEFVKQLDAIEHESKAGQRHRPDDAA